MAPFVSGLFYPARASALRGPGERRAVCGVRRAACDRQQARTRREGWRAETGRAGREQQRRRVGASLALRGGHLKAPRSSAFPLKGSATCLRTRLLHKQKRNPLEKR